MSKDDRAPQIAGTATAFLALAWIFILLRCYCRAVIVKCFGLDDWLSVAGLAFFTPYCAFSITATFYGSGKPTVDISAHDVPIALKWWWACEPVYVLAGMFIKMGISVFLLRICVLKAQKLIIYVVTALMLSISVSYFFVFVFQCLPSSYFWTQYTGSSGTCMNTDVIVGMSYGYSATSCLVDWTLGILPIFLVWNLNMASREKLSVALILAVGALASISTIIRMPTLSHLSDRANFLYASSDVAYWSTIEIGIAIIVSAAATLRPLFRTFFDRSNLRSSQTRSGAWNTRATRAGYLRSEGNDAIGLNLRGNSKKGGTVTTTVRAGSADDEAQDAKQIHAARTHNSDWKDNNSQDTTDWARGITKTMVVETDNEMV